MAGAARQEWVNVTRSKSGEWVARVTVMEGNKVVRASVRTVPGRVAASLVEARTVAERTLAEAS